MKFTKAATVLVFGLFLAIGSVIGVSAQDDMMKTTTKTTAKTTMKPRHQMTKKRHHMMAKKHHKMMKHRMTKKTTVTTMKKSDN